MTELLFIVHFGIYVQGTKSLQEIVMLKELCPSL